MKDWAYLYDYIYECFQQQPAYLTYHNWQHTHYVVTQVEFLARQEQVDVHSILLLKTAALFHDIGFLHHINHGHEEEGVRIAKSFLPLHGYTPEEIDLIAGMIRATKIPQQPQTHLEEILADADLYYMGTELYPSVAEQLYVEMRHYQPDLSKAEWRQIQISFLQSHRYHTGYCLQHQARVKEGYLRGLKVAV